MAAASPCHETGFTKTRLLAYLATTSNHGAHARTSPHLYCACSNALPMRSNARLHSSVWLCCAGESFTRSTATTSAWFSQILCDTPSYLAMHFVVGGALRVRVTVVASRDGNLNLINRISIKMAVWPVWAIIYKTGADSTVFG